MKNLVGLHYRVAHFYLSGKTDLAKRLTYTADLKIECSNAEK